MAWAVASLASAQTAQPLRVARGPGAESCPDGAALETRVEQIRQQPMAAGTAYHIEFARDAHTFTALLRSGPDGSNIRNLRSVANDCEPLAQATAVTLALLFDAEAIEPAPPPPAPQPARAAVISQPSAAAPPEAPASARLGLALGAGLAHGILRAWAPALLGELGLVLAPLQLGIGALWLPTHETQLAPGRVELGLFAASARACYATFRSRWLQVDGCSGFTLGAISASASGYTQQTPAKHRLFAALPLELAFGSALAPASWQLSAALLVPFRRNRFRVDNVGTVYESPALALLFGLRVAGWIEL